MAKERLSLSGKVVAITGGARGIGKATAKALVGKGCRVAIGDLDLELAEQTAAQLGGGTVALSLDVTDSSSFAHFLDEAERQLGPLDAVVNNAGIMPVTPFEDESEDSVRRQVEINLLGVITGTQLAIKRLRPRGRGWIVNIASQAGKGGVPGIATYSGTKHAVVGLSEAVRAELRDSGVGQKWVKPVEASDVANEIVDAMEVPRFDVFVPRANGVLYKILAPLPRSWREALGRAMKVDKLMTEVDHGARRAYEERAAASESSHEEAPAPQRDAA
ncbi:MAG TPA: SDR family oxidoreductase [Solirubrobacterales bacterium]|nr:SDR family oxidoreductase [Solirubrobacterales bacterium]